MMHEFDDDFFFEEDKILSAGSSKDNENNSVSTNKSNLIVSLDNEITANEESSYTADQTSNEEHPIVIETQCIYNDLRMERYMIYHQDLMGMTVTSGSVTLTKDEKNLIGISIGGGAPLCPCLYIVQIFDNTPAYKEGTLQSGDEIVGVNGQTVKGKTKVEVAKMIQSAKDQVTINYNKLHADPKQGKTLDIILKKMKHRMVERMSGGAADALGLSRAILCNDTLVAKLTELSDTELYYTRLLDHAKRMLKSYFDLIQSYKAMGDVFAAIGVKEPQTRASEAFTKFGQYHRLLERDGIVMLKALKPILSDMGTYLHKAIPDTKLTIKKYADTKFEYLSYCLKVKEMDDEEYSFTTLQEPFYRVETGNYEYRLILRCRQDARARFARLRSDVLIKLELLDNKKTQDVGYQLRRFIEGLAVYQNETIQHLKDNASLFPVEVDLTQNAFQYKSTAQIIQDDQEDEIDYGQEIQEHYDQTNKQNKTNKQQNKDKKTKEETEQLLTLTEQSLTSIDQPLTSIEQPMIQSEQLITGLIDSDNRGNDIVESNLSLLTELGLADTNEFGDFQNGFLNENKCIERDDIFEKLLSDLKIGN